MKHFFILLLLIAFNGNSQIIKDSLLVKTDVVKDTIIDVKSSWYGRSMFLSLTTGSDTKGETLSQRICQNAEFGRSFGSVDVGIALGQFRRMVADSSSVGFSELRVTMDACQFGIFSNEISVGAGCLFNSKTPVMMEISSTLFAQLEEHWGLGFVFGNIDFVGDHNDANKSFFGLYFRYGLMRNEGGILTNKLRVIENSRKHSNRRKKTIF
ncbi:hypothetical protein [Flavobacterium sp. N1994]|uniref:hypothetical protein n=1 Tax=Flavobacterium sp. N1994 TaxID=2986827 RepID=UPI002223EAED|nr:hypothetical protein [Flavobacterium sp. N1994]